MAAETPQDASSYIQHHLTFFAEPIKEQGGFWTLHYDTIITSSSSATASAIVCFCCRLTKNLMCRLIEPCSSMIRKRSPGNCRSRSLVSSSSVRPCALTTPASAVYERSGLGMSTRT